MITIIDGYLGTGKTLVLAKLVKDNAEKTSRVIYSDIDFNFPYKICDILEITNSLEKKDVIFAFSNVDLWCDSRQSRHEINRIFTYMTTCSEKMNVDFYLAVHRILDIDIRLQKLTDYHVKYLGLNDNKEIMVEWTDLKNNDCAKGSINVADMSDLIKQNKIMHSDKTELFDMSLHLEHVNKEV